MKKILCFLLIFCCIFVLNACGNNNTLGNKDKGLIENETITFVDKYTRDEYKGIVVEKTYSFKNNTGRTQRLIFIKNTTGSNLYMYVTSEMLDDSGNSVEIKNERIDVVSSNSNYIITEDYYNSYNNFKTVIEISNPSWEPCTTCISVDEEVSDEGDVSITYKNTDTKEVGGKIKIIAYKDGKIVDWTSTELGNLEVGESETYDRYLTEHDKYEVYIYSYK